MSTFADSAPIRPIIWAACHHCRRAVKMHARDPLIADRDTDVKFLCRCGRRGKASYGDPRGHKGVPPESWTIDDRTLATGSRPTF